MRQTLVKVGIEERLGELLGYNPGNENWSIQTSMVKNLRRIIKGVVGNSVVGKIMKGLNITQDGTTSNIRISNGIGFTVAGNIVTIDPLVPSVVKPLGTVSVGQTYYIYLMYEQFVLDPVTQHPIDYHTSEIMGTSTTPVNILSDDVCSNTTDTTLIAGKIIASTSQQDLTSTDGLYIGQVTIDAIDQYTMAVTMTIISAAYDVTNLSLSGNLFVGTSSGGINVGNTNDPGAGNINAINTVSGRLMSIAEDATIGGNLTVVGNITVDEIEATGIASTTITTTGDITSTGGTVNGVNIHASNEVVGNIVNVNSALIGGGSALTLYKMGSFTVSLNGFAPPSPSGTAYYTIINNLCILRLPILLGTSNSNTHYINGFPSEINTSVSQLQSFSLSMLKANNVKTLGEFMIDSSNLPYLGCASFTGSGSPSEGLMYSTTIMYNLS